MNTINGQPSGGANSTMNSRRPVNFYCHAPEAKLVQLVGDFNYWHPVPMQLRDGSWWFAQIMLPHGHHRYRFVVNGQPILDPHAMGKTRNELNEEVSVVAAG